MKNKGITLVALVITIIILLILAGITLNLTLGQNGIITRAQEAGRNYMDAAQKEQYDLAEFLNQADNAIRGTQIGGTTGDGLTDDEKTNLENSLKEKDKEIEELKQQIAQLENIVQTSPKCAVGSFSIGSENNISCGFQPSIVVVFSPTRVSSYVDGTITTWGYAGSSNSAHRYTNLASIEITQEGFIHKEEIHADFYGTAVNYIALKDLI